MKRVVCKDYFLTASVYCDVIPTTCKKYGTIVYPDGTNLRDDILLPMFESSQTSGENIITNAGETLFTNDSQEIIIN